MSYVLVVIWHIAVNADMKWFLSIVIGNWASGLDDDSMPMLYLLASGHLVHHQCTDQLFLWTHLVRFWSASKASLAICYVKYALTNTIKVIFIGKKD